MHQSIVIAPARLSILALIGLLFIALTGSASAQPTTTTTTTTLPIGNALRGGQLWDKWWVVSGAPAPTGQHPLYPPAGLTTGSSTYRCKECHGWDYKGAGGAYATGSHFTGIPGVLGSLMTGSQMAEIIKSDTVANGHGFATLGLTDQDVADLVEFLQTLLIDSDVYIDALGLFAGDPVAGQINFTSGGTLPCPVCHGVDGAAINFATPEAPEWIGTIAAHNPWELMHKIRFGQPGTPMPTWLGGGGSNQGAADIGAYVQLNLPVDCLNAGHCDDGNPCTDDTCNSGYCDNAANLAPCDDGLFCNGLDICKEGQCGIHLGDPCAVGEFCNEPAALCESEPCVEVTVGDGVAPVQCSLGAECTVGVELASGSFNVASVVATVAATTPVSCGTDCIAGTAATNGSCMLNDTTCRFVVADLASPITPFADGNVSAITLHCTAEASGQLCVTDTQAGSTNGATISSCGQNCVPFECTACIPGDCNATGTIDAGDPICAVLCLVGSAPTWANCSCGADCNCLDGTDASDPVCTVLRLIDSFSPDTCTLAPPPASLLYRPDSGDSTLTLEVGELRQPRKGRRLRATVRLSGESADIAAGMRAALWGDARIRGIRLPRRLRRAGFSLSVGRADAAHVVVVVTPARVSDGVPAFGGGSMLRVRVSRHTTELAVTSSQFGSILGVPLP